MFLINLYKTTAKNTHKEPSLLSSELRVEPRESPKESLTLLEEDSYYSNKIISPKPVDAVE